MQAACRAKKVPRRFASRHEAQDDLDARLLRLSGYVIFFVDFSDFSRNFRSFRDNFRGYKAGAGLPQHSIIFRWISRCSKKCHFSRTH